MTKTFFISDLHFHHHNAACVFKRNDGSPLRPFSSVEEMDDTLIQNWNSTVTPDDRVYVLGDFTIPRRGLQVIHSLNGRIAMILGNHDPWKKSDWSQFQNVDRILGVHVMPNLGFVMTHVPVHPSCLESRAWKTNIHGHLHANSVLDKFGKPDKRYFNVSVEMIDYTPIEIEDLKARINACHSS